MIELKKVKTYKLSSRKCKVEKSSFGTPTPEAGTRLANFINGLPKIQAAKDIINLAQLIIEAYKNKKSVIFAIGGHVIKTGVTPYLIDLAERGIVSFVAMNGAAAIHDFEIAFNARTSEDVAESLQDGTFGMAYETGHFMNRAFALARRNQSGAGFALYRTIDEIEAPYRNDSLVYRVFKAGAAASIHIAIGTDIVHVHPDANGEDIGAATFNDFRVYCEAISKLEEGSVYINFGSAVVMPEVFLKALTLTRNLGHKTFGFHTANFDMITHYRPQVNVLGRPTLGANGKSFNFNGCHEIMLPLLHAIIIEKLGQ